MWLYEHENWPDFKWDNNLVEVRLENLKAKQIFLNGRISEVDRLPKVGMTSSISEEMDLHFSTSSVVSSSWIEGEFLGVEEVRSSIADELGIGIGKSVPTGSDVNGIVKLTLDATRNFKLPLTKDRLFSWHKLLFPTGYSGFNRITVGGWRLPEHDPMRIVSGGPGRERVHYEAPTAERVELEMSRFLNWFEKEENTDFMLKSAISHFWFEAIHPFADGNGRIGRVICDLALARANGNSRQIYSLSSQIAAERSDYYKKLEEQQSASLDISGWLTWFLDCLDRAIDNANAYVEKLGEKILILNHCSRFQLNDRQTIVIGRMLDSRFKGFMNASKYAKMAKCSSDTALSDIAELENHGILLKNSTISRNASYRLLNPENL